MNKKALKSDNRWKADDWLFHGRALQNLHKFVRFSWFLSSDTSDVDKEQEISLREQNISSKCRLCFCSLYAIIVLVLMYEECYA
jgi:hypothetical protein